MTGLYRPLVERPYHKRSAAVALSQTIPEKHASGKLSEGLSLSLSSWYSFAVSCRSPLSQGFLFLRLAAMPGLL